MQLFLQSPDQTLSREDAFFKIYNYEMDPENRSVDILASKLRKKIAKVDSSLQIQALRGRGYRLIAQERVAKEEPMSGMSVTKHETPEETPILDPDQLARTLESNDQALQREFYEVFLAHASTEIESLAAAGGNPDQVRASAHQLKSSSQSVGTPRLTQALIALEKLAKSTATDSAALKAAALDVKNIWLETSQAIESRIIELNTR
jgi:HPt (histidine-containing phosphotransfer) domain-containing protein